MYYSELQYDSYDEYLDGQQWQEIKALYYHSGVLYRCRICHKRRGLLLHKRSYAYLTPEKYLNMKDKMIRKILVYLCHRCNELIHFYKKGDKVPLDYLFLYEREQEIYYRWQFFVIRFFRDIWQVIRWFYYSYKLGDTQSFRR